MARVVAPRVATARMRGASRRVPGDGSGGSGGPGLRASDAVLDREARNRGFQHTIGPVLFEKLGRIRVFHRPVGQLAFAFLGALALGLVYFGFGVGFGTASTTVRSFFPEVA